MAKLNVSLETEDKTLIELGHKIVGFLQGLGRNPFRGLDVTGRTAAGKPTTSISPVVKAQAIAFLRQGLSTEEVARKLGIGKMQVAAFRAHITMGTYTQPKFQVLNGAKRSKGEPGTKSPKVTLLKKGVKKASKTPKASVFSRELIKG